VRTLSGPVGPSTEWREEVAADEAARFERHAETLRGYQRYNSRRGTGRALHRKAHGGARAELEVHDGIEPAAAAGLFARPGHYDAVVRFSNGLGLQQPDWMPDVRGLAVKVLGVPGPKIFGDATTQDFLLISTPALPFANVDGFVAFVNATENRVLTVPRLVAAFGPARTAKLLRFLAGLRPPASLATIAYYSGVPIAFGDYAGKLGLFPEQHGGGGGRGGGRLREELARRLRAGPIRFTLKAQLYRDPASTPIENAAVVWDAPFVDLATLTIPAQEPTDDVEQLSFDPWHALPAHRPLGNLMRARSNAYRISTRERGAAPEPPG
jgi:hypothetical protein